MPSTPVRVLVMVAERRGQNEDGTDYTYPGFWAGGRFWPNGESEAVLEDIPLEPLTVHNFVTGEANEVKREITVAQQLRQLEHAKGGQIMGYEQDDKGNPDRSKPKKSPALLIYKVMDEPKVAAKK